MGKLWNLLGWRVWKWEQLPVVEPKDTRWVAPRVEIPEGRLPGKSRPGRGAKRPFTPEIRPIPQRGGALHAEARPRAPHKAVMRYKGKGTKTQKP
ncbi:MAG TPA: hypothetical protein VMU88_00090 [bacterium]|nr:hypothetical protein [bacterium]